MNTERLAAYVVLLAQPDPKDLKPRRHLLTQPGKRERWEETWVPSVQIWTALRLAEATGPEDGWKPARRPLSLPLFLQPVDAIMVRDLWRGNATRSH